MLSPSVITGAAVGLAGFTFFASLAFPRLLPVLFVLMGVLGAAVLFAERSESLRTVWRHPVVVSLMLLLGYLFINAIWAINSAAAVQKSILVLSVAAATILLSVSIADADTPLASRAAKGAIIGFCVGILYLMVDLTTGRSIWLFIHNQFPSIFSANIKNVSLEAGRIESAGLYLLNRNVTLLVLLFWPVFLLLADLPARWRLIARATAAAAVAACVVLSDSQTSLVALIAGAAVYMLAWSWRIAAKWTVLTAWIIGMVLAVPLGALPHKLGWTSWTMLEADSAAARFYIWSYTAEKVKERPIAGIGVRGTRELQTTKSFEADRSPDNRFRLRPGRHSHNAFLQIWLELGAIGAGLVLAFGVALLGRIGRLTTPDAAAGYAMFATVCCAAAFGYGIWQTWFLAGFGLAATGYVLGLRIGQEPAS